MKKISILDQFAADAIGAPAVVTGGGGGCKPKSGSKHTKAKTKSHHSHHSHHSRSHQSRCCC